MKQQLIQTSKATILVVDLPEGAEAWKNDSYHTNTLWYKSESMRSPKHINLPDGEWQLLGKTFELSRLQCAEIVKYVGLPWNAYKDYTTDSNWFNNPVDSFASLLTANGVFKENPISSEKPIAIIGHKGSEKICEAILKRFQDQWQEAEQHVFMNAYTLIKK